jgi:hypothetical protein
MNKNDDGRSSKISASPIRLLASLVLSDYITSARSSRGHSWLLPSPHVSGAVFAIAVSSFERLNILFGLSIVAEVATPPRYREAEVPNDAVGVLRSCRFSC